MPVPRSPARVDFRAAAGHSISEAANQVRSRLPGLGWSCGQERSTCPKSSSIPRELFSAVDSRRWPLNFSPRRTGALQTYNFLRLGLARQPAGDGGPPASGGALPRHGAGKMDAFECSPTGRHAPGNLTTARGGAQPWDLPRPVFQAARAAAGRFRRSHARRTYSRTSPVMRVDLSRKRVSIDLTRLLIDDRSSGQALLDSRPVPIRGRERPRRRFHRGSDTSRSIFRQRGRLQRTTTR